MKIVGNIIAVNFQKEDYQYSDVIDSQTTPNIKRLQFQFAISELKPDQNIDVELFCSEDGVEWTSMDEFVLSFDHTNTQGGVYGCLEVNIDTDDERFKKFGFNCNGDNFDALLFGAVVDVTP